MAALQSGAPANDACAGATVISTNQFQETSSTTAATTDAADPTPSCGNESRGQSVWYRFTAPADGTITVNTFGSDYDTILSAYTGNCGALTPAPEDCNDDDPRDGAQSQVTFVAEAGGTYFFMVTAYDDDGGSLVLRLAFLRSPVCVGDCNGDGTVTQSECGLCARIHGGDPLSLCPACDSSGDGDVALNELGLCSLSSRGCITPTPSMPKPTPSPTPRRRTDDCDGDGRVAANDIVRLVAILANCPCSSGSGAAAGGCNAVPGNDKQCVSADVDGNGCVSSSDLERALANLFESSL